jgi:hypothetical protein
MPGSRLIPLDERRGAASMTRAGHDERARRGEQCIVPLEEQVRKADHAVVCVEQKDRRIEGVRRWR